MKKLLQVVLPHISIILSGMMIVFFVIDRFNSAMGFMTAEGTKILIFILSVVSIAVSCALIIRQRRDD